MACSDGDTLNHGKSETLVCRCRRKLIGIHFSALQKCACPCMCVNGVGTFLLSPGGRRRRSRTDIAMESLTFTHAIGTLACIFELHKQRDKFIFTCTMHMFNGTTCTCIIEFNLFNRRRRHRRRQYNMCGMQAQWDEFCVNATMEFEVKNAQFKALRSRRKRKWSYSLWVCVCVRARCRFFTLFLISQLVRSMYGGRQHHEAQSEKKFRRKKRFKIPIEPIFVIQIGFLFFRNSNYYEDENEVKRSVEKRFKINQITNESGSI